VIPLTLAQLADVVAGDLVDDADQARMTDDVTIDSRTARDGSLFVPVPGERADGHDFIRDAVARGATAWLCAAGRTPPQAAGGVVVDDPADALLGLGAWVRDTVDPVVVAVTGSNGKTTVKDLIAAAVSTEREVVANPGSYNNELGVPLTCCRMTADTDVLVAEVGARGVGHIAALMPVLRPDIAVLTTVSGAHLELFGDVEVVARAKRELVEALSPDGVAVLNADDPRVAAMAAAAPGDVVTYGRGEDADWRAEDVTLDELARATFSVRGQRVQLPVPGEHMVANALAALAVADVVGIDVAAAAEALSQATVSRWRMELLRTPAGVTILNDAYNANPASMEAALKTLALVASQGRRWAVLGEMAELGPTGAAAHDRVGRLAIRLGIDGLVVVGERARPIRDAADLEGFYGQGDLYAVDTVDDAVDVLAPRLRAGDVVLVKASRAAGLERVAEGLAR
jgi:UDP-N-acetylmuramoyl-tripeptide--D-alanyl-D-alanine ligase